MKVITYQAPDGQIIDISRTQERKLTAAAKWPRNESEALTELAITRTIERIC